MTPIVLSIAGMDPSGGAGALADVKTISACGCYGVSVITALTAQNTQGVRAIHAPPAEFVGAQIDAVFSDMRVDAVKIGMLGTAAIANVVADRLLQTRPRFVVLDPVVAATSGDALATGETIEILRARLTPLASLLTPNLAEAALLAGLDGPLDDDALIAQAGARLLAFGAGAALVKGGHGAGPHARDLLFTPGARRVYATPWVVTRNTHGTGCTLASAIACELALGASLEDAVDRAKTYLTGALRAGKRFHIGQGHGPLDHFWRMSKPGPGLPEEAKTR